MIVACKMIVEEFEANMPIPTSVDCWREDRRDIMLYLAAKRKLEGYIDDMEEAALEISKK